MQRCLFYKRTKRWLLLFLLPLFLTSQAQVKTEILWDHYGVPHIYGKSTEEMYYAFGRAQMHNHANLVLQLYGQARGRSAEYWGKDYVRFDKLIHLFDLPGLARQQYAQQKPEYKSYLDAFVKGLNDYAKAHPTEIGKEVQPVLPVTAYDVLAHTTKVIALQFLASDDIDASSRLAGAGSNALAIAPSKSASKNALLLSNPHLPWSDFFTWFEVHLNAPGFDAYGAALAGMPWLGIAFNQNLGWTHTVNTIDASDRYALTLKDGGYLLDGKTVPFETRQVILKLRQDDGTFKEETDTFRYAKQGPVVGEKGGKAYAVRIAGLQNSFLGEQYHKMAKAKNLAQFEAAVKMLQMPMFNVVYADKAGNILYLFNGDVPVRSEGDWQHWHGTVDGTASKYIWTKTHPYRDLPKLLNPATGFVQNANDPPWTCTYPTALDPNDFPAYMSLSFMGLRPQRIVNLIKGKSSVSFDDLVGYKLNTGMEAADRFLDDLLLAAEQYPDSLATAAATVLKAWDGSTNADGRGALLFQQWFSKMREPMFAKPWTLAEPVTTPDGLKDPKQAVDLLKQAATEVLKVYGSLDVAYGDVNRFRMSGLDYPGNGGDDYFGIYRAAWFDGDKDGKNRAVGGDSYVAVTEFGKKVKASVLLSYGNASQPGSKHIGDQLQLLSEKKLRPALLEKSDVLKNLEQRETVSMRTSQ